MKSKFFLRSLFLGCSFITVTALSAQTLVTSWEAEDYILNGFAGGSGIEPAIESIASFSGGKGVRGISKSNLIMQNFYVPAEGTYELKIYYSYTKDQSAFQGGYITTRINSQVKQTVASKLIPQGTAVGEVFQIYSVLVYCEEGWNTLKIGQNTPLDFYTPYIDKCEVYTTESTISKPADDATALLTNLYPESFTTKNVMYNWDFTNNTSSISLAEGTNATLANLTDNDLSTVFSSAEDSVQVLFTFIDTVVVKHIAFGGLFKLGKFKLEYKSENNWLLLDRKSAYSLFADGGLWNETKAGDKDSHTEYRLTLYKAPGAGQIEVADVLFHGYLYSRDVQNGTGTYAYMKDDITNSNNGAWMGATKAPEIYNGLTGFQTLDNARNSKYSVAAKTFQIVYKFNYTASVSSFILSNASTSGRDAKTWEIQGSNDSVNWTSLYRAENLYWKGRYFSYGGVIANPAHYQYYRFDLQSNNGDSGYAEIGDLLLFGVVNNGPVADVKNSDIQSTLVYTINHSLKIRAHTAGYYEIYDVTGKMVKQGTISFPEVTVPVNEGFYFVRVRDDKNIESLFKVIVR